MWVMWRWWSLVLGLLPANSSLCCRRCAVLSIVILLQVATTYRLCNVKGCTVAPLARLFNRRNPTTFEAEADSSISKLYDLMRDTNLPPLEMDCKGRKNTQRSHKAQARLNGVPLPHRKVLVASLPSVMAIAIAS
jgi:hypothetical protein